MNSFITAWWMSARSKSSSGAGIPKLKKLLKNLKITGRYLISENRSKNCGFTASISLNNPASFLMPVLFQLNNVSKHYGARQLLEDACASFSSDQKIGMIGRNGAGKSTLCKIVTGQEEMDSGTITKNADLRL